VGCPPSPILDRVDSVSGSVDCMGRLILCLICAPGTWDEHGSIVLKKRNLLAGLFLLECFLDAPLKVVQALINTAKFLVQREK
jgi:hypothetical protein